MENQEKKKTHTSTAVKARYKKKTYTRIAFDVRKEKAEEYKEKCRKAGIPYSLPLHNAVEQFLNENE